MAVIVVTSRFADGTPETIDTYADGSGWRFSDGRLSVRTARDEAIGTYADGQWISVLEGGQGVTSKPQGTEPSITLGG